MKPKLPSNIDAGSNESDDVVIGTAFRWSAAAIIVLAAAGAAVAWWLHRPPPAASLIDTPSALPTRRELPDVQLPQIPFTDITIDAGIHFVHENGAYGDKLLPETMGGGCAFFDFDNDGDQDILLVNSCRWPWDKRPSASPATLALYRNDGAGHFMNATAEAGLDVSLYGMGVAVADYNGDGFVDVFISAVGPNRLFKNEGGKRFVDVTGEAQVAGDSNAWSTSCGWFDYDRDGDFDLLVCNYVSWTKDYDLSQNFQLTGGGRAYGRPQQFSGTLPYLYRNDGDGTFTDVSAEAGIQVANPSTGVPIAKSLGLAFADFDGDGWLDVFVANDTVQNMLFHNEQNGKFREVGELANIAYDLNGLARGAMGIDVADFRNDGEVGIAIGNFANEMSALYVSRNRQLKFRDDAIANGLGPATRLQLTFGVFFFDADLDGRLDYLQANGHLEEDIHKVQATQFYQQPPQLFWNTGSQKGTEFVSQAPEQCGAEFVRPMVGRGAAYADIDGDGDLDVLLTASGGAPRLLRNDQKLAHHWLRVKLVGAGKKHDAIGAVVKLIHGNSTQVRFVSPTRSYLSESELPVTFGLGTATVDRLIVRWPTGEETKVEPVVIDRQIEVRQP